MERPKKRAVFAPRLLLIDGDPTDRAHSAQVLAALFPLARIKEVADELGFLASLEKDGYDVVVTELGLHDSHWLFLLGAIRATQPRAVTIVFTHRDDPDSIRSALRAGAADVVVKSSRGLLDLGQSIDGMLRNASERVGSFDDHEELGRSAPSGRSAPASRDREAASASSETGRGAGAAVP